MKIAQKKLNRKIWGNIRIISFTGHKPPPPLFPMETRKQRLLREHIENLVKPIFEAQFPAEEKPNTMIGARGVCFSWRPNNYRLVIPYTNKSFLNNTTFGKGSYNVISPSLNTTLRESSYNVKVSNYGRKLTTKVQNCTLMVDIPKKGKSKITAIYKPLERFHFLIKAPSLEEFKARVDERVLEIEKLLIEAANGFAAQYGGRLELDGRKWVRHEDEVHGEDYIDSLPPELVIHDTYFKKVYRAGVEFKSPAHVKNYISNRAVEELAPDIAEAINSLGSVFEKFSNTALPPIQDLALNMGTHVKVMKNINAGIGKLNKAVDRLAERQAKLREY